MRSAGSFLTGIEPVPSSVEAWTPSHWTTGKSLTEGLEKKTWESLKYRQKVYTRSEEHALFPSPTKIPAMSHSFLPFNLTSFCRFFLNDVSCRRLQNILMKMKMIIRKKTAGLISESGSAQMKWETGKNKMLKINSRTV